MIIKKGNRFNDFPKKHLSVFFNFKPLQIYEKKQTFQGIVLSFSEKNLTNHAYCFYSYDFRNSASKSY